MQKLWPELALLMHQGLPASEPSAVRLALKLHLECEPWTVALPVVPTLSSGVGPDGLVRAWLQGAAFTLSTNSVVRAPAAMKCRESPKCEPA